MASQASYGHGNTQIQIINSASARVLVGGRETADLFVPNFRQPLDAARKDLDLLLARYAITDLAGRQAIWEDCLAWSHDGSPVSVRCITGRGGSGKTRFALELLHHLRSQPGWAAYFVRFSIREPFDLWAATGAGKHVLLVFDYASDVAKPLAESLQRLANRPPQDSQQRLRVLLLARTASWEQGWLATLKPGSTIEEPIAGLFHPVQPVDLPALALNDRIAVFGQALARAAAFANLAEPPLPSPELFAGERAQETLRDPLTLIMAAVVGVRTGVPQALSLTRLELAQEAAELLVAQRFSKAFPENAQLALHMAAYLTLCGGLSRDETREAVVTEAAKNHCGVVADSGAFVDRLQDWLPGEKTELGPILPDIVGEAFILGSTAPRLVHPEDTVLRAVARKPQPVVHSLVRAIQDVCLAEAGARTEPLQWLERILTKGEADDFSLLRHIESELPYSTVVLRPHAVRVMQLILDRFRALARATSSTGDPLSMHAEIAGILNNLSFRQSEVGRRKEALATAREAVEQYRELVVRNREAFLPDLAMSLNNLSNREGELGRREEALATAREAVALRRELVVRNRDAFLPDLAGSLNNQANREGEVGLREEALATAREAVELFRQLAAYRRDAFLPDLAGSLGNLANWEGAVGRREEALATAQEAVDVYRELVARNRDAFLPDLARTLDNLATLESGVGRREKALATAREAVALMRELVTRNREAFLSGLSMSLSNLANRQGEAGLREEALAMAREAVDLCRELVARSRDAFLPNLAGSLNNLANREGAVGRREAALPTAQEAVDLYRELVARNRDAFLPDLAGSLNNLANREGAVGRREQALVAAREAVALRRESVACNRDAFSAELARSLGSLGAVLLSRGLAPEAASAFAEGLRTLLPYAERYPQALAPLGGALLSGYAKAVQQGALDFDGDLLSEAIRILGPYLKQEGEET